VHDEELHDVYCLWNIIMVIKPRRTILAGHVACMWAIRYAYRIKSENLKTVNHLKDLDIDGGIILKMDLLDIR
jgi:hypothetical protein